MRSYSDEEREKALSYAMERMDALGLMRTAVSAILEECADALVSFILSGASQELIDVAIESLAESLLEWIDIIAVGEHDRRDDLLFWLHGEWNDGALEDVVRKRSDTFRDEVAVVCAVGVLLHRGKDEILSSVKDSLRAPWMNPLLVEFRGMVLRGEVSVPDGLDVGERHYGSGIPVSSLTGLEGIAISAVADGWTWWQHEDEAARGAVGYQVLRGSSFPCAECDSHTGVFYPIADTEHLPQYHAHCMCFVVYIGDDS